MFRQIAPCGCCPFRRGNGEMYRLNRRRLMEAVVAVAFQCHATLQVDETGSLSKGDKPQQCAGMMTLLRAIGRENQIMQIGERLGALQPDRLDPGDVAYKTLKEVFAAHGHEPPTEDELRAAEIRLLREQMAAS